ncbi:hypothetical protein H6G80_22270 [Nostoc sp. FACHB-87]|uniref:hypothetical protein n=1 Tax=Nostocaceae TaxID=1162 RepID=UPI0016837725|nr:MULTISPECIES: hypothetical protein [Nostocaceae]MBD2456790.1 hypothetical protein [Nostoc sp. FACHB-87]MBD2476441.1 hypothetical protein [Anabaena sp. FACHB-83]
MPNPRGTPENLEPGQRKGEESLTEQISFRASKDMKDAVKAQPDPAQFCRDAVQEKLDKQKQSD